MLTQFLFAASIVAAAPAVAQPAGTGEAPSVIAAPAQAFSECVRTGVTGLAATVTAEAGAKTIASNCAAQRAALEAAVESMIATLPISDAEKAGARTQMQSEMAKVETSIAEAIKQSRTAPSAKK